MASSSIEPIRPSSERVGLTFLSVPRLIIGNHRIATMHRKLAERLFRNLPGIAYQKVAQAIEAGTQFVGLSDFTALQNALLASTARFKVIAAGNQMIKEVPPRIEVGLVTFAGSAQVAQIITFGRLKARAVLKDVGRVLQMPYGQVDRLAKMVPNLPADPWTLERTLNGVSEMVAERDRDPKVAHLLEIALQLEGLPRHSSTHAAGVVIAQWPQVQPYSARLHSPQMPRSSLKRRFTGLASAVCLNCTTML